MVMTRERVEARASELHGSGYHCAESVLAAVAEHAGISSSVLPRVATAFGGGVGRTQAELCGALAGGLMAIGCVAGRDARGASWDHTAELAVELRERFEARFGATRCADILATFPKDEATARCRRLSGSAAGLVLEVLDEGTL